MKMIMRKEVLAFCLLLTGTALFSQQVPATAVGQTTTSGQTETNEGESTAVEQEPSVMDLPGFPVLINTGDPVGDDIRYGEAKEKWFAENKRLVKKYYRKN